MSCLAISSESIFSLLFPESALPHSLGVDAVLIKLMHQLVGIFLNECIIKLPLVLSVDQPCVFFANLPLLSGGELLDRWEAPRSVSVVFCDIFVGSKFHLKVQLCLIWLPKVFPGGDQVLVLATLASVIEVYDARSIRRLPRISSFKENPVEKSWPLDVLAVNGNLLVLFAGLFIRKIFVNFHICVSCQICQFRRFSELSLEVLSLPNALGELFLPLLLVVVKERWGVINSVLALIHVFLSSLAVLIGVGPLKSGIWVHGPSVVPQSVYQRQVDELAGVLHRQWSFH